VSPSVGPVALAACLAIIVTAACDRREAAPLPETAVGADAGDSEPVFVDVAGEAGIEFVHSSGATGEYHLPEIMGSGVALLDYDNDGDLDIYALQAGPLEATVSLADLASANADAGGRTNRLFRNELVPEGRLRFVDVTAGSGLADAGYGQGVAVGDIDNDGDPDIFLSNYGVDRLFRNDGDGRFSDITSGTEIDGARWTTSASFFDYDLDGDLDLFATYYVAFNHQDPVECWFSGGTGAREYCGPLSLPPLTDRLWRNDGDGRFTDVSRESGIGAATGNGLGTVAADFDGDGRPDVYVANDQQANRLWANEGEGRFTDSALMSGAAYNFAGAPEASMGISAGDFDGDGDEDLFMTHFFGQTNTLLVNDGGGGFSDHTDGANLGAASLRLTGWGTRFFDYDNDGWLDLFIANGAVVARPSVRNGSAYAEPNQLFRNAGGRFEDVSATAGPAVSLEAVSRGAAFGDVDNDGDVDIVVTNVDGPLQLLENRIGNRRHWLSVRVRGGATGRDGTGARVALLRSGQPATWRRVHTDGSYLSASDGRIHFGLGDDPSIEAVGIEWPDGRREIWREGLGADAEVELTRGTGSDWSGSP
jgi:hypothetical protein